MLANKKEEEITTILTMIHQDAYNSTPRQPTPLDFSLPL